MALFSGTPQTTQQIPTGFTPQQSQVLNQLLQQGSGGLQSLLGGGQSFEPIAQQARTQFQQQTIPSIAERFTAMDGQRSSAFTQELGQAGAGLESSLAGLGAQFGQQQRGQDINALMSMLQMGLAPQFQTESIPAQESGISRFAGQLGPLLLQLLPMLLGGALGGPAGAAAGGAAGSGLSSLLNLLKGG